MKLRHRITGAGRRALSILLGTALALIVLEVLLRLVPFGWPLDLDNYVHSCYEADRVASSIWFFSERPQVRLHKPHFETRCQFNHRGWWHRSDQLGNRNPEDWERADVLLLGDSMVYGHGVEEPETFASRLRAETGRRVVNAGQTDSSAVEYLAKVQSFLPLLHPKVVVIFLYRNDLGDIRRARTSDQVRALIEHGVAPEARTYTPAELFEKANPGLGVGGFLLERSQVARVVRYCWLRITHRRTGELRDRRRYVNSSDADALAYQRAALQKMLESARATGSKLVLGYMPTSAIPDSAVEQRARRVRTETQALAERFGLPFFDPSPALVRADGHSDPAAFLDGDWHLNAEGHRRLAHALAEFLRQKGALD